MKILISALSLLLLMNSSTAKAVEVEETMGNLRALGMGGIYMSIVNDSDAVFYNPAALNKVSGLNIQLISLEAGLNGIDIYNQFKDIKLDTPNSYNQLYGKHIWIRAGGRAAVAIPNFGVGAFTDNHASLELHNPAFPQFATQFTSDFGYVVGGSFPVAPATHAGIAIKKINRWGGAKDIDLGTLAGGQLNSISQQFQDKGTGYGVDLALQTALPAPMSPTISLVWQDVGSTAFNQTAGSKAPPRIHDNLSVGASTLVDLPGLDWTLGAEFRHITESEYQIGQKVHLGTEISLPLIDLRAGLNQGYASYGLGFNFLFMSLDLASYTEERGAYAGQTPENRVQIGLSIDLSFDADFSMTDSSGRKRKLKQRR